MLVSSVDVAVLVVAVRHAWAPQTAMLAPIVSAAEAATQKGTQVALYHAHFPEFQAASWAPSTMCLLTESLPLPLPWLLRARCYLLLQLQRRTVQSHAVKHDATQTIAASPAATESVAKYASNGILSSHTSFSTGPLTHSTSVASHSTAAQNANQKAHRTNEPQYSCSLVGAAPAAPAAASPSVWSATNSYSILPVLLLTNARSQARVALASVLAYTFHSTSSMAHKVPNNAVATVSSLCSGGTHFSHLGGAKGQLSGTQEVVDLSA